VLACQSAVSSGAPEGWFRAREPFRLKPIRWRVLCSVAILFAGLRGRARRLVRCCAAIGVEAYATVVVLHILIEARYRGPIFFAVRPGRRKKLLHCVAHVGVRDRRADRCRREGHPCRYHCSTGCCGDGLPHCRHVHGPVVVRASPRAGWCLTVVPKRLSCPLLQLGCGAGLKGFSRDCRPGPCRSRGIASCRRRSRAQHRSGVDRARPGRGHGCRVYVEWRGAGRRSAGAGRDVRTPQCWAIELGHSALCRG
jgi:hypothetical protein